MVLLLGLNLRDVLSQFSHKYERSQMVTVLAFYSDDPS